MYFRHAAIAVSIALPFAGPALAQDTSWCKSKYGPNDEIGAANLLSAQGVLDAAKLIKTGKTYALGVETNKGTPAYAPRTWNMIILQPGQVGGVTLGNTKTSYNDDIWNGWVGIGSQIDGLGTSVSRTSTTIVTSARISRRLMVSRSWASRRYRRLSR